MTPDDKFGRLLKRSRIVASDPVPVSAVFFRTEGIRVRRYTWLLRLQLPHAHTGNLAISFAQTDAKKTRGFSRGEGGMVEEI